MTAHEPIVGIDLGTTNSLVAILEEGGPRVLTDELGRALLPSIVRYEPGPDGKPRAVVGDEAKAAAAEHPATTIASVKRLMGRSRADVSPDLPYLSYSVIEGEHQTARIALPLSPATASSGTGVPTVSANSPPASPSPLIISPQEVSAAILRELKSRASRALGREVAKAVVTVPAYFDDAQRQATRDAGRLAGLDVVRIVNEPTAAALAYGLGLRSGPRAKETETVAVFDLGGGTFDVSILRRTPGADPSEPEFFQVLSTAGDTHLGGDDVDQMLVELFLHEIAIEQQRAGAPAADLSASARQRLREAAEEAKRRLSEHDRADIAVQADTTLYQRRITREEFDALITPWVERALDACGRAVRDAGIQLPSAPGIGDQDALDTVVMVGGSTRIPLVRRRVAEFFGLEPYTALDPDQVVALGAAVQAGILSGAIRGTLLLDVLPLSLGIETVGGAVAKLIMRNSAVPARATEMFSTSIDGQTSIKLHILQGEREMAADCRSLGVFHLRGLPPMPAGIPQLEVEFLVDANGVLNVSAAERRSGRRASLQVVPSHGLTREEVDRMEREAFAHAREDMERHRIVDLITNSKLDLKWIGERFGRFSDRLEPAYRAELEGHIASLRALVQSAEADWRSVDANAFHAAKEALDRASVRLQEVSIAESLRDETP